MKASIIQAMRARRPTRKASSPLSQAPGLPSAWPVTVSAMWRVGVLTAAMEDAELLCALFGRLGLNQRSGNPSRIARNDCITSAAAWVYSFVMRP